MIEQLVMMFFVILSVVSLSKLSWERDRRRDYETDLCGMIVRGEIDSRNLRRSTRHKEIRKAFDRRYQKDGTLKWIDKYRKEESDA